jgi:hypothetical protein
MEVEIKIEEIPQEIPQVKKRGRPLKNKMVKVKKIRIPKILNRTEYMHDYNKAYNIANKQRLYETVVCELCGGKSTRKNISHHQATRKHQQALTDAAYQAALNLKAVGYKI